MAAKLNSITHLTDFASYGNKLDISHAKLHLKSKLETDSVNSIIVNSTSLPNKYWDYIKAQTYKTTLTDEQYLAYRYQPKMYCYDKFGTTELWSLLLKVNNMTCVTDFNTHTFLTFHDSIFTILNEILILEDTDIAINSESMK